MEFRSEFFNIEYLSLNPHVPVWTCMPWDSCETFLAHGALQADVPLGTCLYGRVMIRFDKLAERLHEAHTLNT